ncbi:RNA-binding S4 domain-containing protein [Cochlodiniinecator piscidefendens]|uniref:RNA-binding S4 domain-containing protein n=1 Tax=Cochlodiniinecator piscidefendens TaxID=2715756 RepID=UPI001408D70B
MSDNTKDQQGGDANRPSLRIDKWLWHARFFKTRSLSAKVVTGGHMRVNGEKIAKTSRAVSAGDVLTFLQEKHVRVIKVVAIGERRGPAPEARTLYEDLTPEREIFPSAPKFEGKGRPTKKDRRDSLLSKRSMLD